MNVDKIKRMLHTVYSKASDPDIRTAIDLMIVAVEALGDEQAKEDSTPEYPLDPKKWEIDTWHAAIGRSIELKDGWLVVEIIPCSGGEHVVVVAARRRQPPVIPRSVQDILE